ncbi:conserved hypothetical protein [Trichinella spiralis]|uniref:hypothetical protein n=1 Tax=Trichinella spiralis TaxID=6334 RepID=UPI0001EFE9B7|nr:conserved hypothetical protein [Trichinella spiralis]
MAVCLTLLNFVTSTKLSIWEGESIDEKLLYVTLPFSKLPDLDQHLHSLITPSSSLKADWHFILAAVDRSKFRDLHTSRCLATDSICRIVFTFLLLDDKFASELLIGLKTTVAKDIDKTIVYTETEVRVIQRR